MRLQLWILPYDGGKAIFADNYEAHTKGKTDKALVEYANSRGWKPGEIHRLPFCKSGSKKPCVATPLGWLFAFRGYSNHMTILPGALGEGKP